MATNNIGFGFVPFGNFIFGFGEPATADALVGFGLEDAMGNKNDTPLLDIVTGSYDVDANGQVVGTTAVQVQVQMALTTTFGSSSLGAFGNTLKSITTNNGVMTQNQVKQIVYKALAFLTNNNTITIVSIVFNTAVNASAIDFSVNWVDQTNNGAFSTVVSQ